MEVVLSGNISAAAKKLAADLDGFILEEIADDMRVCKDLYCMIVVKLCSHLEHTEVDMCNVCYDDISAVAQRLKIMVEH